MAEYSVDVIVPTWNRGDLLCRAVKSVLRQSHVHKIIVVDNGTQRACLSGIDDERVILVLAEPCIGASAARNLGAQYASSPYIAFLDDDDYWQEGFLSRALPLFEKGADIVVGRLMREMTPGVLSDYKLLDASGAGLRRLYFSNPGFGGQNFVIRRDFFLKIDGFDSSMPASNDRDFAVRAIQAGAVIHVQPESVAVLCDHDGVRVRKKQVKGNFRFIMKHWPQMTNRELFVAVKTLIKRFFISHFSKNGIK